MRSHPYTTYVVAAAFFATTEAAFAAAPAAPGPIAAVGAPALLIIGGAFLAVRYLRSRGK